MIRLNVHEAKTHLSRYLDEVENGEVVVICRRNVPIAEVRRVEPPRRGSRNLGWAKELLGEREVPDSFFDPLPDDVLAAFNGESE